LSNTDELTGEELDRRAAELNIEGRSSMSADEKREAIAQAEADGGGSDASEDQQSTGDPFRDEQKRQAAAQNLTQENAVPEQRPQASQVNDDPDSPLTKRLKEAKHPSISIDEPMGQEAYDRAQAGAESGEEGMREGVHPGSRIEVTGGVFEGEIAAVLRVVEHGSVADLVRNAAGRPEQLYNQPQEIEVSLTGGDRDGEKVILNADDDQWVKLNESFAGSRAGRRH
jgi:hypothetical protein